jgi:septal ring factor EnvC (AmiA/AmiB activator)
MEERKELEDKLQELKQQHQKREDSLQKDLEALRKENASLEALRSAADAGIHFEATLKEKNEDISKVCPLPLI